MRGRKGERQRGREERPPLPADPPRGDPPSQPGAPAARDSASRAAADGRPPAAASCVGTHAAPGGAKRVTTGTWGPPGQGPGAAPPQREGWAGAGPVPGPGARARTPSGKKAGLGPGDSERPSASPTSSWEDSTCGGRGQTRQEARRWSEQSAGAGGRRGQRVPGRGVPPVAVPAPRMAASLSLWLGQRAARSLEDGAAEATCRAPGWKPVQTAPRESVEGAGRGGGGAGAPLPRMFATSEAWGLAPTSARGPRLPPLRLASGRVRSAPRGGGVGTGQCPPCRPLPGVG